MDKKEKKSLWQRIWKRKFLFLILIVILGIVGWRITVSRNTNGREMAEVQRGTVDEVLILTGDLSATDYAQLSFQTNGELSWIGVEAGDYVQKGQALAKLDTVKAYQAYEQAQANLRAAQATLDRVYDDVQGHEDDENFTQRETRTAAETAKDKAYRALVAAQHDLANSTLTAPFDGIVTYVANPFSGINTTVAQPQIEIVNPDTIYFEVTADQTEVIQLHEGQNVSLTFDAFPEEEVTGRVTYISYTPVGGEAGTVYNVRIALDTLDIGNGKLRMGMTGDATFVLEEKENVLYIPPEFINSDNKGEYLQTDKEKKYIEVGLEGEDRVEVITDIPEGTVVYD